MKKLLFTLFTLFTLSLSYAQLTVEDTLNPLQMVQALEGVGVKFDSIDVSGCPGFNQMLEFDGSLSNIGIDYGLLMTNGDASLAENSNTTGGAGATLDLPGDDDLTQIVSPDPTADACVIEFDLKMSGDTLRFNYVFASEEYPEFSNPDDYNDVFGFFISGPNINGPFSNNAENIALLPDNITPVSIFNINNGSNDCGAGGPNGPCTNCQFYVDNCNGTDVEYDGFTTKLTAKYPVIPCETYHLKLAISDAGGDIAFPDGAWDSGVFLENGSFASAELDFGTAFSDIFEGCTEGGIDFNRKDTTKQEDLTIYFSFKDPAANGTQYGIDDGNGNLIRFPDSLIMPSGVNTTTIDLIGNQDGENEEDQEIVIFVLIDDCVDGKIPIDSITLTLHDFIYLDVFPDTLVCPGEEVKLSMYFDADNEAVTGFSINDIDQDFDLVYDTAYYDPIDGLYKADSIFPFSSLKDTMLIIAIEDSFSCVGYDTLVYDVLESDLTDFDIIYEEPNNPNVIQFRNLSQFPDGTKYLWDFGDSSGTSTQYEPLHEYPDIGKYIVSLSASGKGITDCPLFKEIEIRPLQIPNIITPNGDGINDTFEAYGMYQYHLKIFNRWGKKVFEDIYYQNTFSGENLNDGMYFYEVSYPNKGYIFKGWFQLVR